MMIRQASGIASRLQTNKLSVVRSVASQSAKADSAPMNFVEQRKIYDAELALLRKGWAKEIQLKKEREATRVRLEREQIVLRQAVRLRQNRVEALLNKEREKIRKGTADLRFAQHLARNEVVRVRRSNAQQMRYSNMVNELCEESKIWITNDNINQRINEGIGKKNALLPGQSADRFFRKMPTTPQELTPNRTSIYRFAELFLEPMINTGAEREKFSEIVQQVGDTLSYMDKHSIYKDEANANDRKSDNWLREKTSISGECFMRPKKARKSLDPRAQRRAMANSFRNRGTGKYDFDNVTESFGSSGRKVIPRTIEAEEQAMRAMSPRNKSAVKRVPRKR